MNSFTRSEYDFFDITPPMPPYMVPKLNFYFLFFFMGGTGSYRKAARRRSLKSIYSQVSTNNIELLC